MAEVFLGLGDESARPPKLPAAEKSDLRGEGLTFGENETDFSDLGNELEPEPGRLRAPESIRVGVELFEAVAGLLGLEKFRLMAAFIRSHSSSSAREFLKK